MLSVKGHFFGYRTHGMAIYVGFLYLVYCIILGDAIINRPAIMRKLTGLLLANLGGKAFRVTTHLGAPEGPASRRNC